MFSFKKFTVLVTLSTSLSFCGSNTSKENQNSEVKFFSGFLSSLYVHEIPDQPIPTGCFYANKPSNPLIKGAAFSNALEMLKDEETKLLSTYPLSAEKVAREISKIRTGNERKWYWFRVAAFAFDPFTCMIIGEEILYRKAQKMVKNGKEVFEKRPFNKFQFGFQGLLGCAALNMLTWGVPRLDKSSTDAAVFFDSREKYQDMASPYKLALIDDVTLGIISASITAAEEREKKIPRGPNSLPACDKGRDFRSISEASNE